MNPEFTLNTTEFSKAVRECLAKSSRELSAATNSRMFAVALKAFRAMRPADKASRQAMIKTALMLPGRNGGAAPRAALILQSRRAAKGQKGLYGVAMKKAVTAFINKEKSKVGYLRSAFHALMQRFGRFSGGSAIPKERGRRGVRNQHRLATPGFNPVAEMNSTVAVKSDQTGNVSAEYQRALNVALAAELEEMKKHLANKMQAVANEHNAR